MPERSEHNEDQERAAERDDSWVNQHRKEPVPASHHARGAQPAAGSSGGHTAAAEQEGKAVRDMMGGPAPQGDVPDAPATQIAATDKDNEEGQRPRVRYVANAVPGQPDGEVDTRS
jgi:hypothetical protein